MKKAISIVAVILALCCMLTACSKKNDLVGKWTVTEDGMSISFTFNENGTGEIYALNGLMVIEYTYEVKDNTIIFHEETEVLGTNPYTYSIKGDELSITGGGDVMVLTKEK